MEKRLESAELKSMNKERSHSNLISLLLRVVSPSSVLFLTHFCLELDADLSLCFDEQGGNMSP